MPSVAAIAVAVALLIMPPAMADQVVLPKDIAELPLKRLTDRLYVIHSPDHLPNKHNKGFMNNPAFVLTDRGVVVIDPGGSLQVGRVVLDKIASVTKKPVVAVFNTHAHGDHWLGNQAILQAFPGVPIYAHERAIQRLRTGEAEFWRDLFLQLTEGATAGTETVLPTHGLKGGETIMIDGTAFHMHHIGRAHSDNDIMIEAPGIRTLFLGDVVANKVVQTARPQDFSIAGQIRAVEFALMRTVELYIPGHGPSGGREIPEASLQFLTMLRGSVKRYYDQGLADYQMKPKVIADLDSFRTWTDFEQIGRLISFVYLQVEDEAFQ